MIDVVVSFWPFWHEMPLFYSQSDFCFGDRFGSVVVVSVGSRLCIGLYMRGRAYGPPIPGGRCAELQTVDGGGA